MIYLPKIYMNASQYEEVKDGAERCEGACRDEAENGVDSHLAGRIKKARIDMEVVFVIKCKIGPSPRGSSNKTIHSQSLSKTIN